MSPATLDVILGVLLVGFALKGLMSGMLRSLATLAAVLIAWWAASAFPTLGEPVARLFWDPHSPMFALVTRLLTWAAAFAAVQLVGFFLANIIERVGLSPLDKAAGLLLGAATGVLVGCVPLLVVHLVPPLYHWDQTRAFVKQSALLSTYEPLVSAVVPPPPKPSGQRFK